MASAAGSIAIIGKSSDCEMLPDLISVNFEAKYPALSLGDLEPATCSRGSRSLKNKTGLRPAPFRKN